MKNKLFITIVCITISQLLQAQAFKLGFKGGANVTKIAGSSFNEKFNYGYHAGGFVQIKLSKKLTLQPEVLMSQINTTVDSSFDILYQNIINPNYVHNISLHYLTIPVVLNYNLGKLAALQGGVQYATLMQSSNTFLQNGQDAFKHGDLSVLAGIQFKLGKLMLSGRYLVGLNNINDIDNRDQWKNETVQISIGLRL